MIAKLFLDLVVVLATVAMFLQFGLSLYITYFKLGHVLDLMEQASGRRLTPLFSGPKGRVYLMIEVTGMAVDAKFALAIGRVMQIEVDAIPDDFKRMARTDSRVNLIVMTLLAGSVGLRATGWFD